MAGQLANGSDHRTRRVLEVGAQAAGRPQDRAQLVLRSGDRGVGRCRAGRIGADEWARTAPRLRRGLRARQPFPGCGRLHVQPPGSGQHVNVRVAVPIELGGEPLAGLRTDAEVARQHLQARGEGFGRLAAPSVRRGQPADADRRVVQPRADPAGVRSEPLGKHRIAG